MAVVASGLLKNKMTTIRLKGGLGNQMFQYAYGRNLMISKGKSVVFDISFYRGSKSPTDSDRPFLLNKFKIPSAISFTEAPRTLLEKIADKIFNKEHYFQNEKYFITTANTIRNEFVLKDNLSNEGLNWKNKIENSGNSISVHIRRGDYVNNPVTKAYHGTCSPEYYEKAISYISDKVQDPSFFVFSDNLAWVKKNISFNTYAVFYVSESGVPDHEELFLMSRCTHNIIANSSFSWWGAWLNPNPSKIIIAPKKWSNNDSGLNIIPASWIKM